MRRQTSSPSSLGIITSSTIASGPLDEHGVERRLPVVRQLDLVAVEGERAAQRLPDGPVVVDDEYAHGHQFGRVV